MRSEQNEQLYNPTKAWGEEGLQLSFYLKFLPLGNWLLSA